MTTVGNLRKMGTILRYSRFVPLLVVIMEIFASLFTAEAAGAPSFSPTMFPTQSISNKPILLQPTGPFGLYLSTIATDDSGQNVIGKSESGPVLVSQNYGYGWVQTPLPMSTSTGQIVAWNKPVVSGNGLLFYATNIYDSCYYMSSNPSTTWSQVYPLPSATSVALNNIAVDTTGAHIFIAGSFSSGNTYGSGVYSSNSGQSFTILTSIPFSCEAIAIDSTGTNLVCLSAAMNTIYISTNSGATFTTVYYLSSSLASYEYVDLQVFGSSYYNANQNIYVPLASYFASAPASIVATSTNNGATFTDTLIGGISASTMVYDITVSGNGQQIYIASIDGLIYSTDGGTTWYRGTTYQINAIAVSKSGDYLYAQTFEGFQASRPSYSLTSSPTMAPSAIPSVIHWESITLPYSFDGYQLSAISNNGSYVLAAAVDGNLISYVPSTGKTAIVTGFPYAAMEWNSISLSGDGNRVVVIANNVPYYMYNRTMKFHQASLYNTTNHKVFNTTLASSCAMNVAGNVTLIGSGQPTSYSTEPSWGLAMYVESSSSSFTPVFTIFTTFKGLYCSSIGVDATGMTLIAICQGTKGSISFNQGVTWTTLNYPTGYYPSMLGLSQLFHGKYLYAIASNNANVEVSSNQGVSFSSKQISSSIQHIYSIQSSENGQVVAVATNVGYYISYTYGTTWTYELPLTANGVLSETAFISTDVTGTFFAAVQEYSSTLKLGYHTYTPMPTFVPTRTPTAVPSYSMAPTKGPYTGGWVFGSYYVDETPQAPVFYSGYRLGYCFANSSSPTNALWYEYSCSDTYIKVSSYDNADCTGTPLSSQTMPNPSDNIQCTSNTTLPYIFDNGFHYSVDQYYADITYGYNASSCYLYDTVRFDAYINNICIYDPELQFLYYAYFPYVLTYPKSQGCVGPPLINMTFPAGCTSMMTDDMMVSNSPSGESVMLQDHIINKNSEDKKFGLLTLSSVLHRFREKATNKKKDIDKQEERELGLFYYGDDYTNFEGHSFYRYPIVIDVDIDIDGNYSLSAGAIAGIVIGVVCGCCLFLGCIAFFTGGLAFLIGANTKKASAPAVDVELAEAQTTSNPIFAKQAK